ASASEILALNPDGVVISGGPGTPDVFSDYLSTVNDLLQEHSMPIFAVASGMQIFALALDLKLEPLDTGYFANNHPVRDINTDRVYISNQNLRYALHSNELTDDLQATHLSLVGPFVQGFEIKNRPHFAIQAIPEANPGPNDLQVIFDKFINLMSK